MPTPIVPPKVNKWINSPQSRATTSQFPLNLCAVLPFDVQQKILRWITENYAWPQIQERAPYEGMWDAILEMYRINMKKIDSNIDEASQAGKDLKESPGNRAQVSDSVVHDAIERLTDITHFVSFKEALPCQYVVPTYFDNALADQFYDPLSDRIDTMNALLQWNFDSEDIYRKYVPLARHHYLYGLSFARSEFAFEAVPTPMQNNQGQAVVTSQFTRLGTTFDPISIRKIWLNFRLSAYDMDLQPCPFFCEEMPRWALQDKPYQPDTMPFGYFNLDKIPQGTQGDWMFGSQEMESMARALTDYIAGIKPGTVSKGGVTTASLLSPENSVEMLWHFYPMLPLDENTGDWMTYANGPQKGQPVPMKRYIVNTFGLNFTGQQTMLRLQRNYFPKDQIPLYGSCHMPDLDSGLYTPSIGYLLWNHYKELVTCLSQYITNKDWINNPPSWHTTASPAANANINEPGAKIPVLGPNDFGWREPFDATASTSAVLQMLRDSAKQTSKSTDALMGQAMGGRTSATEASNAFQASMSAVTTPINLFNSDMMGGYAKRMWDYAAKWMPVDVLRELTGQMGLAISPEDLWLSPAVRTNTGSTYIESIVRQQNIQYVLQTGAQDPSLNRTEFWKMLLKEMKFPNAEQLVNDNGVDKQIAWATKQAIEAFNGQNPMVSPDQDHSIAMRVLTSFLEDQDSVWMTQPQYKVNAMKLVEMIQIHQGFLMLQLQQQLAHAQAGMPIPGHATGPIAAGGAPPAPPAMMPNSGGMAQLMQPPSGGTM